MDGLLILDKPRGASSHDLVNAVRRMTGEKRVGHAGTLDPMATGVLVLCLGRAVRLSEYLIDHDKRYRALVQLGVETDTYDATGQILSSQDVDLAPVQVESALRSFVGKIEQIPPAHSAVQKNGVRAYKLARQGVAVELEPRPVEIYSIVVRSIEKAQVEFDVHCSKGTYIRSLAHDLGAKLGTGAHLAALRRLASGVFTLEQSVTLDQLRDRAARGDVQQMLVPMDRAVSQFDAVHLDTAAARAVCNGQFVRAPTNLTTALVRAYDERGQFIGLLETTNTLLLKPKKILD